MTPKELRLAARFLDGYSELLGTNGCNDFSWPLDWTVSERKDFVQGFHAWNGDPEEVQNYEDKHFTGKGCPLGDFAVAGYLGHLIERALV